MCVVEIPMAKFIELAHVQLLSMPTEDKEKHLEQLHAALGGYVAQHLEAGYLLGVQTARAVRAAGIEL